MHDAISVRGEPRIIGQLGEPERLAQAMPLTLLLTRVGWWLLEEPGWVAG